MLFCIFLKYPLLEPSFPYLFFFSFLCPFYRLTQTKPASCSSWCLRRGCRQFSILLTKPFHHIHFISRFSCFSARTIPNLSLSLAGSYTSLDYDIDTIEMEKNEATPLFWFETSNSVCSRHQFQPDGQLSVSHFNSIQPFSIIHTLTLNALIALSLP